jgi:SAM-dependent methyltransferase
MNTLPYDTGVFDMVHLRFLSLGLSESAWPALLDEALRVLTPGGHLEIVDLSISLPASAPPGLLRSFASLLMAEMINPDPSLPIQFALPMMDGLGGDMGRAVFEKEGENILEEAGWTWVRSALEYKDCGDGRETLLKRGEGELSSVRGRMGLKSGRGSVEKDCDDGDLVPNQLMLVM